MAPPQPVTPRKVMAFFLMHGEGKTHQEIGGYFGYGEDWSRKSDRPARPQRHSSEGALTFRGVTG